MLLGGFLVVVLVAGSLSWLLFAQAQLLLDSSYPGAQLLSEGETGRFLPNPVYKMTTSYITQDSYPDVLSWHAESFGLGTIRRGLQKCTHTYDEHEWLSLSYDVAITVCDTRNGRMIFVERTTMLRCRWQYCPRIKSLR